MSKHHWILTDTMEFVKACEVLQQGRARQRALAHQHLPRSQAIDKHVVCSILVEEIADITVTLIINLTTLRCAIAAMYDGHTSAWVEINVTEAGNHFRKAGRVSLSVKPDMLKTLPEWFWMESNCSQQNAERFGVFVWEVSLWKAFRQFCWARMVVLLDCSYTIGFTALVGSVVLSIAAATFGFNSSELF